MKYILLNIMQILLLTWCVWRIIGNIEKLDTRLSTRIKLSLDMYRVEKLRYNLILIENLIYSIFILVLVILNALILPYVVR